ncbi:recQ-mediated genome instability protein 2 [Dunckerocampus dactyliophorus]|uniref:recQ-mediated genome instability protein 2 n=1 Tax=Dunckerocampus dactyliophorus TaxID=161453 RepID=UPI0024062F6D|nr:recQ-mediated genome instability protein 2 [Dunckerocampus dactyliophorus]
MDKPDKAAGDRKRPPPVKVLAGQLRTATEGLGSPGEPSGGGWVVRLTRARFLSVSLVWMQGTVLEVQLELDSVLLMDETGTFAVQGVNSIPKGKPCLSSGKYVMVMGAVQAVSPEPVIRAVKMADLSEQADLHRKMWKLEVEDLQQVLVP